MSNSIQIEVNADAVHTNHIHFQSDDVDSTWKQKIPLFFCTVVTNFLFLFVAAFAAKGIIKVAIIGKATALIIYDGLNIIQ